MIFFETTGTRPENIDTLAVLVNQLRLAGVDAAIPVNRSFYSFSHYQQFDLAHLVTDQSPRDGDRLVLIEAHKLNDASLIALRQRHGSASISCLAVGPFESRQSEIGTRATLSYVLGQDPEILSTFGIAAVGPNCVVPVIGVAGNRPNRAAGELPTVLLCDPDLEDPNLRFLASSRKFKVIIVTRGKDKQDWIAKHGTAIAVYHYSEILPSHLACMVDVFAIFSGTSDNYRVQTLIANLVAGGAILVDCSENLDHASTQKHFIRGPRDAIGLQSHLTSEIIPNLTVLRQAVAKETAWLTAQNDRMIARLAGTIASVPAMASTPAAEGPHRVVIVPTNGVGLGHAQRTSLIATDLDRSVVIPVFAAFPSCLKMINSYGFDAMPLVSRTGYHAEAHANDMVNYLRLNSLANGALTLVFDGGYVFDSIYRTIHDLGLNGIWIRRGMWQAGQDNSISLDREKVFGRVIVPTEAFEELNQSYSDGDHIRNVGPIVQTMGMTEKRRAKMRSALEKKFARSFDKLVVTMLGGGVAAKRTAQIQAICGMMEARKDTLHLVVVWPTATVEAGTFTWSNTRVVKTHHASALVAASDLYISAVGYNAFHEVLYNEVPTIFMPQMSSFMDDQRARAMAAVERGLAAMVEPEQLMALRQEVTAFLDSGKSTDIRDRLKGWSRPEPGNRAAAALIEEMAQ